MYGRFEAWLKGPRTQKVKKKQGIRNVERKESMDGDEEMGNGGGCSSGYVSSVMEDEDGLFEAEFYEEALTMPAPVVIYNNKMLK